MQKLIDKIIEVKKERVCLVADISKENNRIWNKVSELEKILDTIDFMPRPKPKIVWNEGCTSNQIPANTFFSFINTKLENDISIFEMKQIRTQITQITNTLLEDIYFNSIG